MKKSPWSRASCQLCPSMGQEISAVEHQGLFFGGLGSTLKMIIRCRSKISLGAARYYHPHSELLFWVRGSNFLCELETGDTEGRSKNGSMAGYSSLGRGRLICNCWLWRCLMFSKWNTPWSHLGTDPSLQQKGTQLHCLRSTAWAPHACANLWGSNTVISIWDRKEKDSPPTNILQWIFNISESCREGKHEYKERDFVPWGQVDSHSLCQQAVQLGGGAAVSCTRAPKEGHVLLARIYSNNSRVWSGH